MTEQQIHLEGLILYPIRLFSDWRQIKNIHCDISQFLINYVIVKGKKC